MEIRRLTASDAAAFQRLRLQALSDEPAAFASSYAEEASLSLQEVASRLEQARDASVMGAFESDAIIGMIGVARERSGKLSHKGYIWGVYVVPHHRRRRVGTRLLSAALEFAAIVPGLEQINLSVYDANPGAKQLYVNAGFVAFGFERRAVKVEGEYYNEEHLVRFLRQP